MPGNRVGQILVETYRIQRLIAEGGMGSVYEASHLRLPKRYAVKFLNLNFLGNSQAQARFRREAENIAALDHASVVNLLDYNVTDEGVPFIVMEFLDGEHLGNRIARGTLPISETLRIIAPVVDALTTAHARDILHRDLKPENIVLMKNGEHVKVTDFGVAKIRDGQELTAMNMDLATVRYMAPEQLFGTRVDARTDEFALATVVHEMLSREMASGSSEAVNEVLSRAMAKAPEARFPSVKEFFEALKHAAAEHAPASPHVDDDATPRHPEATPSLAQFLAQQVDVEPAVANPPPTVELQKPIAIVDLEPVKELVREPVPEPVREMKPDVPSETTRNVRAPVMSPFPDSPEDASTHSPSDGNCLDEVPSLGRSARVVWIVIALALGIGSATFAWLYFTHPSY